jgi:proteasome lid subunit RPN8/RPN11
MARNGYEYSMKLYRQNGDPLGDVPMSVDWTPAEECARFEGVRRGLLDPAESRCAAIVPLWSARPGAPFTRGFRVRLSGPKAHEMVRDFGPTYFKDLAVRASSDLVERGLLARGETFRYRVVALRHREGPVRPRPVFVTEEVIPPLPLVTSELGALASGALPVGEQRTDDPPVYVPQQVLGEAAELTREAGEQETGGILIGHLHRDPTVPEVFVEVTAQIPAHHTRAEHMRLTFTSETWTALQAALDLRRQGEIMLGWWHSHPSRAWCGDCPPERRESCPLAADFFSEHDERLQRTVFPRAYSVALVVNDAVAGLSYSMYGWRDGRVSQRGFHAIGPPRSSGIQPGPTMTSHETGGEDHVTHHDTLGRASGSAGGADCGGRRSVPS